MPICLWSQGRPKNRLATLGIILLTIACLSSLVVSQSDSFPDYQTEDPSYQSKGGSKGGSTSSGKTSTGSKTGTSTTTTRYYYSSGGGSVFLICIIFCCVGCIYCCTCGRAFQNAQEPQQDPHYHPAPEGPNCVEMKEMDDCCHGEPVVKHGNPNQLNGYDHQSPYYGNTQPQFQHPPGPQPVPYPGPYMNPQPGSYPGPYPGNQYNATTLPYQITVSPPQAGYNNTNQFFGQPSYPGPGTPAHMYQQPQNELPPGFADMAAANQVPPEYRPVKQSSPRELSASDTKDVSAVKDSTKPPENPKPSQINTSVNWSKALDSVKGSKVVGGETAESKQDESKKVPFTPNNTVTVGENKMAESVVISSKLTASESNKQGGQKASTQESTVRQVDPEAFAKS